MPLCLERANKLQRCELSLPIDLFFYFFVACVFFEIEPPVFRVNTNYQALKQLTFFFTDIQSLALLARRAATIQK